MSSSFGSSFNRGGFELRFGHDRITWAVRGIILITTACFALFLIADMALAAMGFSSAFLYDYLAFSPTAFTHGFVWTAGTYMFLHSGLYHLFFNMLMLYFFGPDVERILGTRQFIWFYSLCGAVGVLLNLVVYYVFDGHDALVIGASGATLGVLAAFAIVDPERQVFLFPIPFPINARALVLIIIVLNIFTAMGNSNTSVATHFGGMFTAIAYMKVVPRINAWRTERRRIQKPSKDDMENLGKEIDNIFKFQDRNRK